MSRLRLALAFAVSLACDGNDVDVVGLERKVEALEAQQRAAEEARTQLDKRVQEEVTARELLAAELEAAKSSVTALQATVDELQAAADKKLEPPKLAGRAVAGDRYKVELEDAQTRGDADAKVTIVMFSDFQCPFCKRAMATIVEVEKEYGKDVRFAMKHNALPMHNRAKAAALAAEAAGKQDKFWQMHDLLYENARDLTDENFVKWARGLKLDVGRFERDLGDKKLGDKIDDHQAQAISVGARGTPAFFINGRFLSGAQPFEAFKKVIDEELVEAEKLIASGTPAASVYERIIATGKEKVE